MKDDEIDFEALEEAKRLVKISVESLHDIPRELANTYANLAYRFALLGRSMGDVASSMLRLGPAGAMELLEMHASLLADMKGLTAAILNLRKSQDTMEPWLYRYTVRFLVDIYTYGIPNAHLKSGLRRALERPFRRRRAREVPNLVDRFADVRESRGAVRRGDLDQAAISEDGSGISAGHTSQGDHRGGPQSDSAASDRPPSGPDRPVERSSSFREVGEPEPDPITLAALKAWRLSESKRRHVPAFHILNNWVLTALASALPGDEEELLAVKGMGPGLVSKYGETILAIIANAKRG